MTDTKQTKQELLNVFHKIVHKIGKDITVKMDYIVPTSFTINPSSLEPYVKEEQKDKNCFMDFCIGTKIGEEILPGICITLSGNLPNDLNKYNGNAHRLKSHHPQARYGLLFYQDKHISKHLFKTTSSSTMLYIDFIEALGPILGSDKIYATLESLVEGQLKSSRIISDAVFGEGDVRSLRKTYS